MEVWREIVGYEGFYWASNLGRIKSRKVIRRPYLHPNGYLVLNLSKEGKHKTNYVHTLVCETFKGERVGVLQVNHKNEIKTDNRIENLEWLTPKENANHGTRNERQKISKAAKKRRKVQQAGICVDNY